MVSVPPSLYLSGFNPVLQSLLDQTTETPLAADLGAATELWKVEPDSPGASRITSELKNSWKEVIPVYCFICARQATQEWCDCNKLPKLAALPTCLFPYMPEELQLYPSAEAVTSIPSGQAGKTAFLETIVSSQKQRTGRAGAGGGGKPVKHAVQMLCLTTGSLQQLAGR